MYALRHATETTATVWCRHTANGALSLVVAGREFSGGSIDTAVGDGTGTVTATGLEAGMSYPFSLRVAGTEIHSGTLRTMPAAGTDFSALLTYCCSPYRPALPIDAAIERYDDLALHFHGGDNIYSSADAGTGTLTINGEAIRNVAAVMQANPDDPSLAVAQLRAMYRSRFRDGPTARGQALLPTYAMVSDHDMMTGDNFYGGDKLLTAANAYQSWATTQGQADAVYEAHQQVFWEYYGGMPVVTPGQLYFSFVVGDAEFFVLDANSYKVTATGVEYGDTQTAWLLAGLSASTAKWKIIATGEGITEWYTGIAQPNTVALLDHIASHNITGCLMITGDIHAPGAFQTASLACVRGGQVSQDNHTNIPNGYSAYTRYKWLGSQSNGVGGNVSPHAATVLRFGSERLDVDYLDRSGNVFWHAYLTLDNNDLQHLRARLA